MARFLRAAHIANLSGLGVLSTAAIGMAAGADVPPWALYASGGALVAAEELFVQYLLRRPKALRRPLSPNGALALQVVQTSLGKKSSAVIAPAGGHLQRNLTTALAWTGLALGYVAALNGVLGPPVATPTLELAHKLYYTARAGYLLSWGGAVTGGAAAGVIAARYALRRLDMSSRQR